MIYTEEVLKLQLMNLLGYSEKDANKIVEFHKQSDSLDDLSALIDAKKSVVHSL